jgi:ferredoxin
MQDQPFTVVLNDGSEIVVAADQTILDAIEATGRRMLNSCREGNCGTCETDIKFGEADHRDEVLTDDEKAEQFSMMICVSRAKGDRIGLDRGRGSLRPRRRHLPLPARAAARERDRRSGRARAARGLPAWVRRAW